MNPERAFLEDITAHPDDDAPRLIFADWLEDRNQPGDAERAEFIRIQCERAQLPLDDLRIPALRRREQELLQDHEGDWLEECPDLPGVFWSGFERGFVSSVSVEDLPTYRKYQERIHAAAPVQELDCSSAGRNKILELVRCSELRRFRSLIVSIFNLGDEVAEALAGSPHVANLTGLDLNGCRLRSAGFRSLASASALTRLRRLNLSGNAPGLTGIQALAGSPILSGVEDLSMESCGIGSREMGALASSPYLKRLARLELHCNQVGPAGARAVAEKADWPAITHFSLGSNQLGNEGVKALAEWPALSRFAYIHLAHSRIRPAGLRDLVQASQLPSWQRLIVSYEAGDHAVYRHDLYPRFLSLYNNENIGNAGIRALARSPYLTGLNTLEIWCSADDGAITSLLQSLFPGKVIGAR
jgi:uncharacterized protein (TIGR02996 family)